MAHGATDDLVERGCRRADAQMDERRAEASRPFIGTAAPDRIEDRVGHLARRLLPEHAGTLRRQHQGAHRDGADRPGDGAGSELAKEAVVGAQGHAGSVSRANGATGATPVDPHCTGVSTGTPTSVLGPASRLSSLRQASLASTTSLAASRSRRRASAAVRASATPEWVSS